MHPGSWAGQQRDPWPPLLRDFLSEQSVRIGSDLAEGERLGLAQHEEGVSQRLLLDLARTFEAEVSVVPCTRDEEARNGADWVWWFEGRDRWFGALAQAKRLHRRPRDGYDLGYRSGRGRHRQLDLLLGAAHLSGLVPHYVLYSPTHPPGTARVGPTATTDCPRYSASQGVVVLDATVAAHLLGLRGGPGPGVPLASVAPHARPLACLLSCHPTCPPRWPRTPRGVWRALGFAEDPVPGDLAAHAALACLLARTSLRAGQFREHAAALPPDDSDVRDVRAAVRERPPGYVLDPGTELESGPPVDPEEPREPDLERLPAGVRHLVVLRRPGRGGEPGEGVPRDR